MKNNVIKNTLMLYGLSITKIVFPLITLPYLTRVLSVNSYGVVAYVKSVMQYMQILVDFGFLLSGTKLIVEVRNDKDKLGRVAGNIFLSRVLLVIFSFMILIFLIAYIPILNSNTVFTLLSFIPVSLSILLFDYLFRGIEQMETITIRFVLMKTFSTLLTFIFVRSDFDLIWIPILDIIGSILASILVFFSIKKLNIKIRFGKFREALSKLFDSMVYFISNMATTAFGALNTVLIGAFLPASDIAFWSVSSQMIGAIQTLYNPIIDGIYPEMVKNKNFDLIKKVLYIFMPILILGCTLSWFIAPLALKIIGGNQYVSATSLFRCLIPVLFFSFPAMVLGWPTLGAFGMHREVAKSTILTAVFQISGIVTLISIHKFNVMYLALLRVCTEFVLFIIRFLYFRKVKEI